MTLFKINTRMKLSIAGVVLEGLLSGCNFLVLFKILELIFGNDVSMTHIYMVTLQLAGIFILRLVLYILGYTGSQIGGSDVSRNLRVGLGDKLKRIPIGLFAKNRTGYYINAATSEVGDYEQILTHKVADIVKESILLIMVGIYTCTLYLPIGLLILMSTVLIIPAMYFIISRIKVIGRKKNMAREENVSAITEYLTGSQTMRSYGIAGRKNKTLIKTMKEYSDISYHYEKAILPIGHSYVYFSFIVLALSVVLSVNAWQNGWIAAEILVLLIMLPLFVSKLNLSLYVALTAYRNLRISKDKIVGILAEEEEQQEKKTWKPNGYEIAFHDVEFSYVEDEPVLEKADFIIPENKLTAIVGDSGAGKSTILNLISRYYEPQAGDITIGGASIQDMPAEQVLEKISLVDQDVFLFNDTVRNNIRYARPEATDEEIKKACRLANCEEFISNMEQGYETVIGENGNKLSGGERQRLSVARAIVRQSPIILLDEATASLDIENELLVKQAVNQLLTANKTVVMVAHTLPIVRGADQILVLENGKIAECGMHDRLLANDGKYAAMWKASAALQ